MHSIEVCGTRAKRAHEAGNSIDYVKYIRRYKKIQTFKAMPAADVLYICIRSL